MASLTLIGLSDDLKARLQDRADRAGRTLNQQAILLLERAVVEKSKEFEHAYRRFREKHGASPLDLGDFRRLRSSNAGRST